MPDSADRATPRARERDILRLAVPAFLTLVAEPLFLLADSAIILGDPGTPELAGAGRGQRSPALRGRAVRLPRLQHDGRGVPPDRRLCPPHLALAAGLDGLWLALGLGAVVLTVAVATTAPALCSVFGASPAAIAHATTYLRISAFGLLVMFASLALTGILRGLQDTKTPLKVSVQCFTWNIVLNFVFVYGLGMGIAGSALGTVLAQTAMALGLGVVVYRHARGYDARLRPQLGGILHAAADGFPLLIRTMALRAVLLVTTWSAAGFGDTTLAAYQVTSTVWSFLAFRSRRPGDRRSGTDRPRPGAGDVQGVERRPGS